MQMMQQCHRGVGPKPQPTQQALPCRVHIAPKPMSSRSRKAVRAHTAAPAREEIMDTIVDEEEDSALAEK
eukprot:1156625-Pelagomonas_calceolata.AAC.6